jgi:hypothetical protein
MAMSRALAGTSLIGRSPIRIVPAVTSSRPATIRSSVVLPQPEGPTSTISAPSSIVRSTDRTACVPSG